MYSYYSNTNCVITIYLVFLIKLIDKFCLNARIPLAGNYLDPDFSQSSCSPHIVIFSPQIPQFILHLNVFSISFYSEYSLFVFCLTVYCYPAWIMHSTIKCTFFPRSNYSNSLIIFEYLSPIPLRVHRHVVWADTLFAHEWLLTFISIILSLPIQIYQSHVPTLSATFQNSANKVVGICRTFKINVIDNL